MFTGLVRYIGTLQSIEKNGDWRVRIASDMDMTAVSMGASIMCSGVCLTVVDKGADWFAAEISAETLSCTTLKDWAVGTKINLEPSLKMGDALGGHFVFGHVDGVAVLESIMPDGDSRRLRVRPPPELLPCIAAKGSVALDGISLTVNDVAQDGTFGVNIVPHTWAHTTLGARRAGDALNIEIDMLARYVARMLQQGR